MSYRPQRGGSRLLWLCVCLVLLALGPDRESSTFKQRAVNYFQAVVRGYPDTAWAPLAAEAARQ